MPKEESVWAAEKLLSEYVRDISAVSGGLRHVLCNWRIQK